MHLFVLEGLQKHAIKLVWESMQPDEGSGELYRGHLCHLRLILLMLMLLHLMSVIMCSFLVPILHSFDV